MTDLELVRDYVQTQSDRSFTELVHRHIHWVHASALRQVRDQHLAEDVTQAVFIALAQKIRNFPKKVVLAAWLFGVTRRASANARRAELRRKRHEQKAAVMASEITGLPETSEWEQLTPLLDKLIGRLSTQDQAVVLLRFFQQKSFAEVATAVGVSEDAAKKRTERALRRLCEMFGGRGVSIPSAAVMASALGHTVPPAHGALVTATVAGGLSAAHGVTGASAPFVIAKGAVAVMNWAKAIFIATAAAIVLVVGVVGFIAVSRAAAPVPANVPVDPAPAAIPAGSGELSGTVTDEAGNPLANVLVDVWTWYPGNETKTDSHGRFILRKLGETPVEIRFSLDGFDPWYNPNQPTDVANLQVKLSNRTYFEGDVKGPDGKLVSNVLIRADCGPKRNAGVMIEHVWTEAWTNASGHYRMYVTPDTYDIQVRALKVGVARIPQTAIADGETRIVDITLAAGITFQATIVDSETAEPIPHVRLWNEEQKGIEGTSGADGIVQIDGMQPGNFTFEVDAKGYMRWWSAAAAKPWEKKDMSEPFQRNFDSLDFNLIPNMPPLTIELERQVRITGVVEDPDGKPVSGATVAPALTGTGNSLTGDTRFSVASNRNGLFVITLPASGTAKYNLEAHDGKYGKWRKWANGVLDPIQTNPGDDLKDVVIKLTRPAIVRGHVSDASGQPAAGREVFATASDKLENRYYSPSAKTDANGDFQLRFLRPGEQDIEVRQIALGPGPWPSSAVPTPVKVHLILKESEVKEGVQLVATPPLQ